MIIISFKRDLNSFISKVFTPVRVSFFLAVILHLLLLNSITGLFAFNDIPQEETVVSSNLNFKLVQTSLFEEKRIEKTDKLPPVEQGLENVELLEETTTVNHPKFAGVEELGDKQKPVLEEVDEKDKEENVIHKNESEAEKEVKKGKKDIVQEKTGIEDDNIDSKNDSQEESSGTDSIAEERNEQDVEVENSSNSIDEFPPGIGEPWDEDNNQIKENREDEQSKDNKAVQQDEVKPSADSVAEKQESMLSDKEIDTNSKQTTEQNSDTSTKNKNSSYKQELEPGSEGDKNKAKEKNSVETADGEILDLRSGKPDKGIVLPEISFYKKPVYPEDMRKRGIEGMVTLEIMISNEGEVVKVEVKVSSGYKNFDELAKDIVKEWLFKPAGRGEENLACRVLVPVKFRLN